MTADEQDPTPRAAAYPESDARLVPLRADLARRLRA
jgi:hypothetical protein